MASQTDAVLSEILISAYSIFTPPPQYSCAEWAQNFRYLSSEYNPTGGKYRLSTAPYQEEPQECVTDPTVRTMVLKWASQMGKTEIVMNAVGYHIHGDPAPILVVQPTVDLAKSWSKERLSPTIRDTPVLTNLVSDAVHEAENTILWKTFPGGNIAVTGANSPAGLAGRPRRIVLLDEVDRFPDSAGSEGDPVSLATRRQHAFWNAFTILTSTPTIEGQSRIDLAYDETDQRIWKCPCPQCQTFQELKWAMMKWESGKPETARLICQHCSQEINDQDRVAMIKAGKWEATHEFHNKRGYYLHGLNCLWPAQRGFANRLHQAAVEFLDAKAAGDEVLKTWTNTFEGVSWKQTVQRIEAGPLMERCEEYPAEVPKGVLCLVCTADVQANRLEYQIIGFGVADEAWLVDYGILYGNPHQPDLWRMFDTALARRYQHQLGHRMAIHVCFIDCGGTSGRESFTHQVYAFVRKRQGIGPGIGVWACKGYGAPSQPLRREFTQTGAGRGIELQIINPDEAKSIFYRRLAIPNPGPRYIHFPKHPKIDEEYFRQCTAEKVVVKKRAGLEVRKWEKIRSRNEALDLWGYAYAALDKLRPNYQALFNRYGIAADQKEFDGTEEDKPTAPQQPQAKPMLRRRRRQPMAFLPRSRIR